MENNGMTYSLKFKLRFGLVITNVKDERTCLGNTCTQFYKVTCIDLKNRLLLVREKTNDVGSINTQTIA